MTAQDSDRRTARMLREELARLKEELRLAEEDERSEFNEQQDRLTDNVQADLTRMGCTVTSEQGAPGVSLMVLYQGQQVRIEFDRSGKQWTDALPGEDPDRAWVRLTHLTNSFEVMVIGSASNRYLPPRAHLVAMVAAWMGLLNWKGKAL